MIQLQVLNKILNTGDSSLILLNNLDKTFFSDYPKEFDYILNHLKQFGNIPDKASFLSVFDTFDIIEVNENDKYLIDSLYEDRNRRKLTALFNKVAKHLNNGEVNDALQLYLTAQEDILSGTSLQSVDILRDISRYNKYEEKIEDYKKFYINTGFMELDRLIGGWDRNEELATIAARPGVGKTWILLAVAIAAAKQGLRVGIYSGEMSENKIGYRIDTLISHISNGKIIHGNDSIRQEYKSYIENVHDKIKGDIIVLTPEKIGGPAGVNALRAFIEKDKLDILCIDQHSLLEDDRRARNPVERAANISKDLKNLQVLKRIPIIAVSQQNRSSTDDGVGTSHIAQSDRISQDSTIVIFLEQKDDILSMTVAKARDGGTGKVLKYAIDLDKGIFTFIPDSTVDEKECEDLKNEYEDESCPFE